MKFLPFSLVLIILIGGCKKTENTESTEKFKLTETISKEKELYTAIEEPVKSDLMLTGKITFNEDKVVRVFPLAGGFVKELNVELGDYVKKGQVLAIIRSPEIAGFTREGVTAEGQLRVAEKNAQVASEPVSYTHLRAHET
jgi:cobalt-zinc-cadmium efflux system membrane fusion protein